MARTTGAKRHRAAEMESIAAMAELAAAAARLSEPVTHRRLLHLIVETAASVLDAETGSLFLVDPETGELTFEVALGVKEEEAERIRLEPGAGIAGMVAATGQPVAITNLEDDPRHAAEVARQLGREPRNLLCVPLYIGDQVVGVLELLDKRSAPGFSQADMATMGLFANQAAVAIVQSQAQQSVQQSLLRIVSPARRQPTGPASAEARLASSVGQLVFDLAGRGERELRLCEAILGAVADYVREPHPGE